jgi:hypothetical protein
MTSHAELDAGRARRRPLSLNLPVVVEIVDAELPGGNRNRMHITVWVDEANDSVSQPSVARSLTIGFLERVLETLRAGPHNSFGDTALPGSTAFVER